MFGAGVFLAGLELMITAVALPAIVVDLADWTQLRQASWIINGYLLAYVVDDAARRDGWPTCGALGGCSWSALGVFTVGSRAGRRARRSLDELIAARIVQAIGGGVLVPVGDGRGRAPVRGSARPRALGVIGALTFLGMAAGPFVGAAVLARRPPRPRRSPTSGSTRGPLVAHALAPAWRWVFYVNVPIGLVALVLGWAASAGWETARRRAASISSAPCCSRRHWRRRSAR